MILFVTPIFTILLALLHTTSAQPHLHRRGLAGAVYTCDAANFRGNCGWTEPSTRCVLQGPQGVGVQSLGPDPGGFCTLYEKDDCTGTKIQVVRFPGIQSDMPEFGSFRCLIDVPRARAVDVEGAVDPEADPRLAGGVGSMERKEHLEEIERMEEDGFSQGLIGFRKGVYY